MRKNIKYKQSGGKYRVDIDDSGRYGIQFSSYKAMRKAIKSTYHLKKRKK